jgi:excisionase family DNA binding protein
VTYSPDDIAGLLGLHVRTVRGYIRDGRLPAVRIGKQYRISEQALRAFTGDTGPGPAPRAEVTTVVQISDIGRALMDRVSTLVVASAGSASAGRSRLHVHTAYDEAQRSMKVIVVGDPDDAGAILTMISALVQDAAS